MLALSRAVVAGCALAAAVAAAGCGRNASGSDSTDVSQSGASGDSAATTNAPPIALPVTVEPARDGDLVLSIITSGQVRSERESRLKSDVAGTVQRVVVRPGQSVRRGQPLVILDSLPFSLALRQKQIDVDKSRLAFLDMWIPDSLAGMRAGAEGRRRVFMTRSGLDGSLVALEQAKLDRERATIVAPFDGVVDRVEVTEGERIGAGQAIATVVDMKNLRVEASVLEHDIPVIRAGGVATVASSASPNVLGRGRIEAVLAIVDSTTHAGRAYVRLNGNGVLRPGMSVDVRLEATRIPNQRLVPKAAVIERDGRPLVFVVKDGRAEWVYINRGRDNGVETQVLPDTLTNEIPVKPGDQVITRGHLTLSHQAQVRVVRKADTP
ncbi:MAG TPA: efflux RND transporter periplasmic adaptor subunit [Gemmatimonadaceae bacterium]|nr:efflux RND transporter periplasmic adaptor subunit [Gemmatimonadaceae bacterium]